MALSDAPVDAFLAVLEYLYTDRAPLEGGDSLGVLVLADRSVLYTDHASLEGGDSLGVLVLADRSVLYTDHAFLEGGDSLDIMLFAANGSVLYTDQCRTTPQE